MARGGHIPGAANMDWRLAMDRARNLRLKTDNELREMLEKLGVTADKEVITHCQTHHRSSRTYIVPRPWDFLESRAIRVPGRSGATISSRRSRPSAALRSR